MMSSSTSEFILARISAGLAFLGAPLLALDQLQEALAQAGGGHGQLAACCGGSE